MPLRTVSARSAILDDQCKLSATVAASRRLLREESICDYFCLQLGANCILTFLGYEVAPIKSVSDIGLHQDELYEGVTYMTFSRLSR